MPKKAIVLLSGGLDSITVLALAKQQGFTCYALSFDYGQKHNAELIAAAQIAADYQVTEHKIIKLGFGSISGSALTDADIAVPNTLQQGIPVTYVPARNTIFLSFALGWAEVLNLQDIFIGVNAVDYSGYPDCRPEFINAFQNMANLATKAGVEGQRFSIHTPLMKLSKGQIIQQGVALGVDYQRTVSCYSADEQGRACGVCDACRLRKTGFIEADIADPTRYQ
ncbi:MAG: 7-cyano-7-deazaguanine synthase QueC [Methylococcaceae bacterium]|jgi:7-cyano-7-deazaguanine synthase|nr:7-cyano-7-deazaguanine synthase QueC [Methylococcaceae bacterium]MDZ4156391.1 7-cyano-7-deazaguanine synthase QueC [Methylococcales bacterium]MDP2394652.1 7-cyano-7-deazaguanine synthase QueC [Methylococcaceae bacterium]MDP3019120.1 7-cyano-7-deazaguanine synthase QueC [Methylococcaceae bacterium]MDP3390336.1 7-cyano-7-deazaguanine synthase QueC [Methylococcaceae bacterium]